MKTSEGHMLSTRRHQAKGVQAERPLSAPLIFRPVVWSTGEVLYPLTF